MQACLIKDKIFITGRVGKDSNGVELLEMNNDDLSLTSRLCTTSLPENRDRGYTITRIQEGTVVLVRGARTNPDYSRLETVFKGNLNENKDDMIWMELPSIKRGRSHHASFNLENKFYVVGGRDNCYELIQSCQVLMLTKECGKRVLIYLSLIYLIYKESYITIHLYFRGFRLVSTWYCTYAYISRLAFRSSVLGFGHLSIFENWNLITYRNDKKTVILGILANRYLATSYSS